MKGNSIKAGTAAHRLQPSNILFEDNHLIIVNKLPSQIVQGDKTGDRPLSELVKDYIAEKYSKPGDVFLGVVHRLDRPVSGAVIFARTSKALARLNLMVKERRIAKTYWAVVKNKPAAERGEIVSYLLRDEAKNKSFAVKPGHPGAQQAILSYKLLAAADLYYLLEIDLKTGRHHQIRTQLSAMGCPIKGDLKYGYPRSNPDGSIHLHARKLEFIHPVTKENMLVIAPTPTDPLWNFFTTNAKAGSD